MGDVPSTMFVLGTSKEVNRYCKRLIDEIGAGGGFILGSGCTVPYLAKHSNVKAFFDSVLE